MAHKWNRIAIALFLTGAAAVVMLGQTPSVKLDQPYAGDRNVTGQGVPGSAPLTVYLVSGTSRSYLGKSDSIDQQGFYAVAVSPVLANGQQIIVVDSQGHSSNPATVLTKIGPAGSGND